MAVKFPLKMADGALVRTLEELREHFDLASVLSYYENGRLEKWLRNGYYDKEAEQVAALDSTSADFAVRLFGILDVDCSSSVAQKVDLDDIAMRNKRIERLKQFTVDDAILAAVDRVAFTQEELDNLIAELRRAFEQLRLMTYLPPEGFHKVIIYLCGKYFIIPGSVDNITYVGKDFQGMPPKFALDDNPIGAGVVFQDLKLDTESYFKNSGRFFRSFARNKSMGFQLLQASAEESATAMVLLGKCYQKGFGVDKKDGEAVRWYCKAAELGNAKAQSKLGHCYRYGEGVAKDIKESVKWSQRAAEQGDADAQTRLGILYERGDGVEKNLKKAAELYQEAAKQGQGMAQYYLGLCYRDGNGVTRNRERAVEWLKNANNQGVESASAALMEIAPRLFKLSEVILFALGGEENLVSGAKLNSTSGTIDVPVQDRHKVNDAVLYNFGADKVKVVAAYYYPDAPKENPLEKAAADVAAGMAAGLIGIPIIPVVAYGIYKDFIAEKDDPEETGRKDLGWGWVHISMDVTADMEDDFNNNLLPRIKKEQFSCQES